MGSAVRRVRTLLRAQAGGRGNWAALPDERGLQAARPSQWPLPRLQEPDEARVRLREARPDQSGRPRLAAGDLRLPAARGGQAAARMALSRFGEPRDGARGRSLDARLDGERG